MSRRSYHDNDVLCGRGCFVYRNKGNYFYNTLVLQNKVQYTACPKSQKMNISRSIVITIRNQNPPGRFLEFDPDTDISKDIGDKRAVEKTSQALREGQAHIRRHLNNSSSSSSGSQPPTPLETSIYVASCTSKAAAAVTSPLTTDIKSSTYSIKEKSEDLDAADNSHNSANQNSKTNDEEINYLIYQTFVDPNISFTKFIKNTKDDAAIEAANVNDGQMVESTHEKKSETRKENAAVARQKNENIHQEGLKSLEHLSSRETTPFPSSPRKNCTATKSAA